MPIAIQDDVKLIASINQDASMTQSVSTLSELSMGYHLTNVPEEKLSLSISEKLRVNLSQLKEVQVALLAVPESRKIFRVYLCRVAVFPAVWEKCCVN